MLLIIVKRALESTDSGTTFRHSFKFYDVGIRNVFKLVTKSGLELKATANHKALTPLGLVQMEKLKIGDKVLIQSGKGEFGQIATPNAFSVTFQLREYNYGDRS